jgi:hypothetical protein
MAQLPRPIEDYLVGKYDRGACVYLITKEAYKNWVNHRASVRHLCFNNNADQTLVDYALIPGSDYKAYFLDKIPAEWLATMKKDNLSLYIQLFPATISNARAKKSKPTPDDFYLVKYGMPTWYLAKRSEYDNPKKVCNVTNLSEVPAMFWTSKDGQWPACVGTNSAVGNPHKVYKFPQLSSEIKQELQKLNPERYKEWEDFYVAKYPNFKRLETSTKWKDGRPQCGCGICKDCLSRRPLPDPKDDYVVVDHCGIGLMLRSDFEKQSYMSPNMVKVYDCNYGWVLNHGWITKRNEGPMHCILDSKNTKPMLAILEQFEQYYAQQAITIAKQQGSDLDIEAMTKDWEARLAKIKGKELKHWSFEEAEPSLNPKYVIGIDPVAKDGISAAEYYTMMMQEPNVAGVVWTKPRRVGQTKFYEEVQNALRQLPAFLQPYNNSPKYTPSLKQTNHEILFRQTKPIIRREELTNSDIQSTRREFTVTEGHLDNRPVISSRKKSFRVG